MKVNKIIFIIFVFLAFIFGYLVSKMVNLPGISVQKEVNPLHFISILTTLSVAIVVSIIFDQFKEKNKVGKSLFFKRIEDVIEITDKINSHIEREEIEYSIAVSMNKRLRSSMIFIFKALIEKNIIDNHQKDKIEKLLKDINNSMTNTPISPDGDNGHDLLKIENGIIKYSHQRSSQICSRIEVFKNELFNLQMAINDA